MMLKKHSKIVGNQYFLFFLTGQGAAYLSDAFQATAITILIYNITRSGTIAAITSIFQPVTNLFLSSIAGSIGDRFFEKYILILLDFLRALTVIMFAYSRNTGFIFLLSFLMGITATLYNPPARKLMVNLLHGEELVIGNSLLTGVSGVAYLFGPALAGVLIKLFGIQAIFSICGLCYALSVIMTFTIRVKRNAYPLVIKKGGLYNEIKEGIIYFRGSKPIMNIVVLGSLLVLGEASINIAYYPFTFEVLRISSEGWGLILSIFNGANLAAMLISILLSKKINGSRLSFIYLPVILVSASWLIYGITASHSIVFITLIIEGTTFSFCTIYLLTRLQAASNRKYLARIVGMNDIMNSAGRLLGMGAAFVILIKFSPQAVFIFNSLVLALVLVIFIIKDKYIVYN